MKTTECQVLIIVLLLAAGVMPASLVAQADTNVAAQLSPRYRVIDTGTFGGPSSHMSLGMQILNNAGMFTDYADTLLQDPYAPDGCWDGDCIVAHAAVWKNDKLTDIGSLDAGPNSETNWISPNGIVAGDSQNGLLDPLTGYLAWEIRAVVWKHGKIVDVGTLGGGSNSLARAVNSSGTVVGLSTTSTFNPSSMIATFGLPYPFQSRAYRWKNGVIHDLGTLGGSDAMALGINERGQIFGNSYIDDRPSPGCSFGGFTAFTTGAFLWQNNGMVNLGSLGGTCTSASAMNNAGQIAGYSFLPGDGVFHPFLWDRGKLRDLETLGGNFGAAENLNELGDAVGWETLPGDDDIIHATLWSHGQIIDLGSLGSDECSLPFGINSRRQVVGFSGSCDFNDDPSKRAFLWEPGLGMINLNALISPSLALELRNVATINERGEMAVVAFFPDGSHRPVLLVPCDESSGKDDECAESQSLIRSSGTAVSSAGAARRSAPTQLPAASLPLYLRARLARGFDSGRQPVQQP